MKPVKTLEVYSYDSWTTSITGGTNTESVNLRNAESSILNPGLELKIALFSLLACCSDAT